MEIQLKLSATNQIDKGNVIYNENEPIKSICLIIKGRVLICNRGSKVIVGSGNFFGIADVYAGKFINNYIAYDDLVIYAFPIQSARDIEKILNVNKDYSGFMQLSLNRTIFELEKVYTLLSTHVNLMYTKIQSIYTRHIEIAQNSGHKGIPISEFEILSEYDSEVIIDVKKVNYYKECSAIPIEVQKSFYSYGTVVSLYHMEEQAEIISKITVECMGIAAYIADIFSALINDTEICLYKSVAKLGIDIANVGGQNKEIVSMVDEIIEIVNNTEKLFIERVGMKLNVDRGNMEDIYYILLTGSSNKELSTDIQMKYNEQDATKAFVALEDSTKKILEFSGLESEKCDEFAKNLQCFGTLRDKLSTEDEARTIRKKIADLFYDLYEKVFLKAYQMKSVEREIEMFLNYGYVDENLLTKEQILELYYIKEDKYDGICKTYNIKEWLIEIFEGRKEPSKSEFDLDYNEALREIKKTTTLSAEEERDYLTNPKKKLSYEIKNMFRYNNRIVNGQVSTFIPILYKEAIISDFKKLYVNAEKVDQVVKKLLQIDYSMFYRDVLYYDEEKGIKKEYIVEQVFPDIILMPTYGCNAVMWQEIAGKKRNTPGRFLLPIFAECPLEDALIKVLGRFRWELCRSIQGISWNDINNKSLTSEYGDYLQFYRKNRDLSEERKEKLKTQIQKGRNNAREIFTMDYELWVKSESKGSVRLNKVVREIMATYCPFSKEIRTKLTTQPLFSEAMTRFHRDKMKKIKDVESRHRALEKEKIKVPEVMLETQRYYVDL